MALGLRTSYDVSSVIVVPSNAPKALFCLDPACRVIQTAPSFTTRPIILPLPVTTLVPSGGSPLAVLACQYISVEIQSKIIFRVLSTGSVQLGLLLLTRMFFILVWISNKMRSEMWAEIAYPFPGCFGNRCIILHTMYDGCNYLAMPGLKLKHVSRKRDLITNHFNG